MAIVSAQFKRKYYPFPHWITLSLPLKIDHTHMGKTIFGFYTLFYSSIYLPLYQSYYAIFLIRFGAPTHGLSPKAKDW